jgi:general secretion pathway protein A
LTGDVGTGKTALINRLVRIIDVAAIVAKVPDPGLSSLDFFNFLAVELKMNKQFDSKGAFLIQLKQYLHKAYSDRKKVLLVVDEAQRLNHELLEQIRLLSNIELQNSKLINIFFVGQTEFGEMLMEDRNRAVRQRITVSYHIKPLTEAEARYYIKHRLKVAGANREIFAKDAVHEIFSFSGGYPRLINILCDHALLTGYASGLKTIDKKVIKECKRELEIPLDVEGANGNGLAVKEVGQSKIAASEPEKTSILKRTGIILVLIMLLVIGVYYFTSQKSDDGPRFSIEEIAPQKYEGPSLKEPPAGESGNVKVSELQDVQPIIESPLGGNEDGVRKQIQQPKDENSVDNKIQRPADGNAVGQEIQQPAPTDKDKKETASSKTQEVAPLPERKFIIYFKRNSNELPDQAFETLDRIADFLVQSPATSIAIKGYTDSTGNYNYNVSVSEFRANSIKSYLVGKGVHVSRIDSVGLGPQDPIATNETAEGRSKNRRVEIELNIDS